MSDNEVFDMKHEDTSDDDFRVGLTFTDLSHETEAMAAFQTVITQVGHHLSYLDVSSSVVGTNGTTFGKILAHCVNLEHLILEDTLLKPEQVVLLFDALCGQLRDHLLSPNLSKNTLFHEVYDEFAEFLAANPARISALQELLMFTYHALEPEQYAVIRDALTVNKTLRFLNLLAPNRSIMEDESFNIAYAMYKRMEKENQGELLPSPLPLKLKVAFLSVIHRRMDCEETAAARCALDSVMVSTIFSLQ